MKKRNEAIIILDFKFVIYHLVNDPTYKNVERKHGLSSQIFLVSEHISLCATVRYHFFFLINENQMAKLNIFYETGRYLVDIPD